MIPGLLEGIFWASLAVLAYTYAGYQILIHLLAKIATRRLALASTERLPDVTVVVSAYNEQARIAARLNNLLSAEYDPDKLSIIVVDDASTDQTLSQVRALGDNRIRTLHNDRKRGKAACLNQALRNVETELVVFADARQSFEPDAIRRLAAHFSDPRIGAVSGALVLRQASSGIGDSVGLYWKLERRLRMDEARWDSAIGCTGAIYAIRAARYEQIPDDTILDDVVIPMNILLQGCRVAYDMDAVATEPQEVAAETEASRKRRTLAGNFQMLFRYPRWMLPWENRAWWQLISHKYLRILAPMFFAAALVSNIGLSSTVLYQVLLAAQILFYATAVLGLVAPRFATRVVSIPAGLLFLNMSAVHGLWCYLRGTYARGWKQR